jgi:hypothetical protein
MFTGFKLQPCCMDHCRDWRETSFGALPASNHSPACPNYKEQTFYMIRPKGKTGYGLIVSTEAEARSHSQNNPENVATIQLTQDQFDRLAEYEGS